MSPPAAKPTDQGGLLFPAAAAALAGVLLLSACGARNEPAPAAVSGPPVSAPAVQPQTPPFAARIITGADGVDSVVSDISRIVVLNGYINEIVYALGLGDHVVGTCKYSEYRWLSI